MKKVPGDPLNTILKAILPSKSNGSDTPHKELSTEITEISAIRAEILAYVKRIQIYVSDDWKSRYLKMWEEILDFEVVAKNVYNPGKQQGTDFNRNLVANIIHYLDSQHLYKDNYNASTMALALEGDKDHSVRAALGKDPSPAITSRLNRYYE
ncbi:MAG: hypothetical protein J5502_06945 [Prevotella sp.]|nr:hypothetical protein [Prevotella sp.]